MKQIELIGECNRCGSCCEVDGFRCQYLLLEKPIGQPEASVCQVYTERYQGMPIMLFDATREHYKIGHCAKDTQEEIDDIVNQGIGKGCSLTVKEITPCSS